eukprot:584978-Prorocentrum_lima.AAC.1
MSALLGGPYSRPLGRSPPATRRLPRRGKGGQAGGDQGASKGEVGRARPFAPLPALEHKHLRYSVYYVSSTL